MDFVYDRVREFCPKCIYCHKIYLNRQLLASHFLKQHIFNALKECCPCPCCSIQENNILVHVQTHHPNVCLLCGQRDFDHDLCNRELQSAIKHYFQTKISALLNMLEGLESI